MKIDGGHDSSRRCRLPRKVRSVLWPSSFLDITQTCATSDDTGRRRHMRCVQPHYVLRFLRSIISGRNSLFVSPSR